MQVFFSYGHDTHSEVVHKLACEIEKQTNGEITVWLDSKNIERNSHWRERITDGIIKSRSVVAFLSKHSTREESVCRDELSIALVSKHGMIRTILLEPVPPKGDFIPPSRISEYQWADMSDYKDFKAKGEEVFSSYIAKIAKDIIAELNGSNIKKYSDEINALRNAYHLPEFDDWTKFDTLIGEELIGREWLFERIKKWEDDPEGKRILMLYGKPGSGKSMFSAHLQMRDPAVAAAFPCDCQYRSLSTTENIIINISYRLALRIPDYRAWVLSHINDPAFDLSSDMLFSRLILQPLSTCNIDGERACITIVIDALDEMNNDTLAKFIAQNADSFKSYIRFIITSRKVPEITERFREYPCIDLDNELQSGESDLSAYFESKLGEALEGCSGSDRFIKELIKNSNMMFSYARCVCANIIDDIKNGQFNMQQYNIPKGIEEIFKQTLDRSFNSSYARFTMDDYDEKWAEPMSMILASPEPIPKSTLKQLMDWSDKQLNTFCHALSTVLCETDGGLQYFHRSFGEWLNSTETAYYISTQDGISALAEACYSVYKQSPDDMDKYMLLYTTQLLRTSKKREHRKQYREMCMDSEYKERVLFCADDFRYDKTRDKEMQYLAEAQVLYKYCMEECPQDTMSAFYYSAALERIANIRYLRNIISTALSDYNKALEILIPLKDQGLDKYLYLSKYQDYLKGIAKIYTITNDYTTALPYCEKRLEICRELIDCFPDKPNCLHIIVWALNDIGDVYEGQHDLSAAEKLFFESLEYAKLLFKKSPDEPRYLNTYCSAISNIGLLYMYQNKFSLALDSFKKALEIDKKLVDMELDDPIYLNNYAVALSHIADICYKQKDFTQALEYYKECLTVIEKLSKEHPDIPNYLCMYSSLIGSVDNVYKEQNELQKALEYYLQENQIDRILKDKYPENPVYLRGYSISLGKVGDIYKEQNELQKALEYYLQKSQIDRILKDKYPEEPDYLRGYSISLGRLGDIYQEQNELQKALEYHLQENQIDRILKDKYPENPVYLRGYSISLSKVGDIYKEQNELQKALEYYLQTSQIDSMLKDKYPENPDYLRGYSISLGRLGDIYKEQNDNDNALKYYRESLNVRKELYERYPESLDYLNIYALILWKASRIPNTDSEKYRAEAIAIAKEHPDLSYCEWILSNLD